VTALDTEKTKILVIEDNPADARLIREMLREYAPAIIELAYAERLASGLDLLSKTDFTAVLLDLGLPDSKGLDTLASVQKRFPDLPVVILTHLSDDTVGTEAVRQGAQDYLVKGQIDGQEICSSLRYATERKKLEVQLKKSLEQQREIVEGAVDALVKVTEMRDPYTAGHQRHVAGLAGRIAEEMGFSKDRADFIRTAALLHDLGLAMVPMEILCKPEKLDKLRLTILQSHVQGSYEMVKGIKFPWPVAEVILQHHELLDGSGYPHNLQGSQVSAEARILTVSDVMEQSCNACPWRPETPGCEKALQLIAEGSGKLYDARVVDICTGLFNSGKFKFKTI
jgi:putative two-component system response regulator